MKESIFFSILFLAGSIGTGFSKTTSVSRLFFGLARFAGESARFAGESAHFAGESAHFAGESARFAGESARFAGESARFAGESVRFAGESARFAGESARFAGESARFAGESARFAFFSTFCTPFLPRKMHIFFKIPHISPQGHCLKVSSSIECLEVV